MPFKDRNKQRSFQREWMKRRREQWLNENGPCVLCNSKDDLECHHLDPLSKLSHRIWSWSDSKRLKELEKCRVLCGACHKKETARYRVMAVKHGTTTKYKNHRCRCNRCIEAMRIYRGTSTTTVHSTVQGQLQLF